MIEWIVPLRLVDISFLNSGLVEVSKKPQKVSVGMDQN